MINIKKKIFVIIKSSFYLVIFLTLVLFFYAAFFYEPPPVEKNNEKDKITKNEKPSHLQSKKQLTKKIVKLDTTKVEAVISDSLFATVGNKAIVHSDIINEIKTILILNNQSFSKDIKEQLQTVAISSTIKRNVKKIEIEKYESLPLNLEDLNAELVLLAKNINMDLATFENTFVANGINFSNIIDRIQTELLWNSLIFELYKDRLTINLKEIDEQLKLIQNKKEVEEYLISEIIIKSVPKEKLQSTIKEIKNKIKIEGFKTVAINSSIAESALKGGNLGWISENIMAKKFKDIIINTSVGNISEPILLPEGILIFKVRDKRKLEKFTNLEDAKNQLVNAEKTKILNMHSLSHYDNLVKSISINYY